MEDRVFAKPQDRIVDFVFNNDVVNVFPDMIRRSVPGYELVIPVGGLIAARHMGKEGKAFDLGCSLGASSLALLAQCDSPKVRVVGVDSSPAMIAQAEQNISDPRMSFRCENILTSDISGADVVMLNFVVQFLDPARRLALLTRVAEQMDPSGLLILSEKVRSADPQLQTFYDTTHMAWKRANGYSELEVSQKRKALENVMQVDTFQTHAERLTKAGFNHVVQWFHCMNWVSLAVSPTQVLYDASNDSSE